MDFLNDLHDWMYGTADGAYDSAKDRQNTIEDDYTKNITDIANQYKNIGSGVNQNQLLKDYVSGLQNTDTTKFNVDPTAYQGDYTGASTLASVNDYLNPSMDFAIQKANDAISGTAANKGGLFSGATGQAISDNSTKMAQEYWDEAYKLANAANIQEDTTKNTNFDQALNASKLNASNATANNANLGLAYNASMDPMDTYAQLLADMYGTKFQSQTNLNMGQMQNQMANKGLLGSAGDFAGKAFASWIGS